MFTPSKASWFGAKQTGYWAMVKPSATLIFRTV
jgi:hypothetical protein